MLASPFWTPDAAEHNQYFIQEAANAYAHAPDDFSVSAPGDRNALRGAPYRAPRPDKAFVAKWAPKIDDYKKKVYGHLLNEDKLPMASIEADMTGAKSFSIAYDTEFLCESIRFYTSHLRDPLDPIRSRPLSITDAGCGCAGDSMQFLVAVYRDPSNPAANPERIFDKVTGVDIHPERREMAESNFRAVEAAYGTKDQVSWQVLFGNYKHLMKDLRQDIVYIDPPWQGKSGESMVHEEVFLWSDADGTQDQKFGVDGILEALIAQNSNMHGEDERNRTRMLIVKTPPHWRCKMLHRARTTEGVFRGIRITGMKYDYWIFCLCKMDAVAIAEIKCKYSKIEGFQSWQQQEAKLMQWFPQFKPGGQFAFTPTCPLFLQDFWQNADDGDSRDNDKWHTKYILDYVAENVHKNMSLFNGERKLLESSLFTIIYGLKRIQEEMLTGEAFDRTRQPVTWPYILKSTIVLYIGAAGLSADTHHFNELLKFIPDVHFACYDIRQLNTNVPEQVRDRVTIFHKLFTHNDLQRWIAFANKYTDKPIIVISDIRSDWSQAKSEMEAGVQVGRMKIYALKHEMAQHGMHTEEYNDVLLKSQTRTEINELFEENRVISDWVDNVVEKDNFVQWMWCFKLQKYSKSCPIFSAKTREPYQTAKNEKDVYKHMPGGEFLQTHSLKNSTETRTNITNEGFQLRLAATTKRTNATTGEVIEVDVSKLSAKECIRRHFLSFGSADSFASERIDYAHEAPDMDPKELYSLLPERSIHLHDMKLAWYNEHRLHTPSADKAIKYMCRAWQEEIYHDTLMASVMPQFHLEDWFDKNDGEIEEVQQKNAKRRQWQQSFNMSEMIRWDNDHRVTMEIRRIKVPRDMNSVYVYKWLGSVDALQRYEKYLLRQDKIWDSSRESLQTLLILNLNMRNDPVLTMTALNNYSVAGVHQHKDFRNVKTGKFLLGQLRLNIVNPYACKLYQMQTLQLRFDKILQLVHLTRDENDNPLTYMPGSCSPNVEKFIQSGLRAKRYKDNPINIGIDWYCYWLQPLLFDIDQSHANNEASVEDIILATKPFMTFCDKFRGHCLDVDKNKLDSKRKLINLEEWPLGKPILYHACEKGSLSMLMFCLDGLTAEAKTRKINTPRTRVKVLPTYTTREVENYPINTAAFYGHVHIVAHLLECNASTTVQNQWEETPFRSARWAYQEFAISDPDRSENCLTCMLLISQYKKELSESPDDTYRGQVQRQAQVNQKLALSYLV